MAGGYVTMGNLSAVLERIAERHAAIDALHRDQVARAAQARPDPPAGTVPAPIERTP